MSQMIKDPTYGHLESNPIPAGFHDEYRNAPDCDWQDGRLKRITRLRMISDPGFPWWDVSYAYGELKDGTKVAVVLPFHQLSKRKWKTEIINYAKQDGVYAKGLGIFEAVSQLL